MRLIRIHTPEPLQPGATASLGGQAASHVARVLRLRAGCAVTLFNGDGWDYPGTIAAIGAARIEVALQDRAAAAPEPPVALTLVQGISRGERMDFVMQKGTELGVARFIPVLAARGVVRLEARQAARRTAHWQSVVIAACEQCGRARIPRVEMPQALRDWLARPAEAGARRVLLAPHAPLPLAALAPGPGAIELLIGPEGGFEEPECEAAVAVGYESRSLGPRTLRTETAALAAIVALQVALGDLR